MIGHLKCLNGNLNLAFKVRPSPSQKICFICFSENPVKMMKNDFYFILKAFFFLNIFKFLSWIFYHVEKNNLKRKRRQRKSNQTIKFGQSIEYNSKNIVLQLSRKKWGRKTSFRPLVSQKATFIWAIFKKNYFSRNIFLMIHSKNQKPNFIVWLSLLLEVLGNICIAIDCFPDCDIKF